MLSEGATSAGTAVCASEESRGAAGAHLGEAALRSYKEDW